MQEIKEMYKDQALATPFECRAIERLIEDLEEEDLKERILDSPFYWAPFMLVGRVD